LLVVQAPYAVLLGIVAGVTNILPYIGPIFGVIPPLLMVLVDPSLSHLLWPIIIVFVVANVIDNVFIFPVIVAKLVNLNPLILIAVVAVGQEYYGLIGMLISIPIAATIKVIIQEVYSLIYHNHPLQIRPGQRLRNVGRNMSFPT
jgi:putative permease